MKKQKPLQADQKGRMPFATPLIGDIRALIEETRSAVAVTVNAGIDLALLADRQAHLLGYPRQRTRWLW